MDGRGTPAGATSVDAPAVADAAAAGTAVGAAAARGRLVTPALARVLVSFLPLAVTTSGALVTLACWSKR